MFVCDGSGLGWVGSIDLGRMIEGEKFSRWEVIDVEELGFECSRSKFFFF